jgi:hypothetical protein
MMPSSLADELKKLEGLRWNGTLTDAEFERAKAALFAQLPSTEQPTADDVSKLEAELAELRAEKELERIDREWEADSEQYMVSDKNGVKSVPTVAQGIGAAAMIGVFGLIWTIGAISITSPESTFPYSGPPWIIRVGLPLLGVVVTWLGVISGIGAMNKAKEYEKAHAAYRARRAAVKRGR